MQYEQAVNMIKNLMAISKEVNRTFGVKLTNTLPVNIKRKELEGSAMYLSGAALYPIAIGVAAKLLEEFSGELSISYSGGADLHNIQDILETGIYPVTVSSILLKSGGYKNLTKMNELADKAVVRNNHLENVLKLKDLAQNAVEQKEYYNKEKKIVERNKEYTILCAKCNQCVDVCPNRANVLHYDHLCNECGNCSFFCIAGHDPYRDKMTVFYDKTSFLSSENEGVYLGENGLEYRVMKEEMNQIKSLEGYYEF
jgi:putative selenate reductase